MSRGTAASEGPTGVQGVIPQAGEGTGHPDIYHILNRNSLVFNFYFFFKSTWFLCILIYLWVCSK